MKKEIMEMLKIVNEEILGDNMFILDDKDRLIDGITGEVYSTGMNTSHAFLTGFLKGYQVDTEN